MRLIVEAHAGPDKTGTANYLALIAPVADDEAGLFFPALAFTVHCTRTLC
jgi:hypothetical protein